MYKFRITGNNCATGFVNGSSSSVFSANGPVIDHGTISNSPSGLVVRPTIDSDPVQVARSVIARGSPFPNNRIVIQAQDRPVDVTPHMTEQLHSLAQDSGITIGLKVAVEPFAYEFEPASAVARQLEQGALIALPWEMDIRDFSQSLLERMRKRPSNKGFKGSLTNLVKSERSFLTPDERTFLTQIANMALRGLNIVENGSGIAWMNIVDSVNIFKALHDFDGLRRIAKTLENDYFYKIQILFYLEEFETVCHITDLKNSLIGFHSLNDLGGCETQIFEGTGIFQLIGEHAQHYKEKYGYGEYAGGFYPYSSASAMLQLHQDYDLAIPIARGGLNCGSMAELFGIKTRVIEIHAHDREVPTSKFVDDIRPEDIRGKRILLLDKDMVSGASLKEAIRMLAPYQPAAIGAYLTIPITEAGDPEAVEELEGMGLVIHHPGNMQLTPALEIFHELNERLDTPLGQLRKVIREFKQELDRDRHLNPEAADVILTYIDDQERMYFKLNHHLPGMDNVRASITSRLKDLLDLYQGKRHFVQDGTAPDRALTYISMAASGGAPLLEDAAEELARGRYRDLGLKLAKEHEAQHEYTPHSFTAAFHTAKRALADGYDAALIVGPEGFAFQPIFEDLGVPTVAINIPEADFDGERTLNTFDDLSQLKGKRVLVVEDDVQSGATLKKVLEALEGHRPAHLGLFLGSFPFAQLKENIPAEFKDVYSTDTKVADGKIFIEHLQTREVLFKRK